MTRVNEDAQFEQLAHRIEPQSRLLRTWPLPGGLSAHITALEVMRPDGQTQKMIVRRPGEATLKRNPNAAADEFKLLQLLQSTGLPVPAPYYLDASGQIFDTPYLVMEYIEGRAKYSPANLPDAVRQIATLLARIHRLDGSLPGLAALPRQSDGLVEKLARLLTGAQLLPDEKQIRAALASFTPLPSLNKPVLLHGDFWPGNLLWREDRLVAVVDWEDALVGEPLSDFAISRLDMLLIFGSEAMNIFSQQYQSLNPIRFTALPYWDLYAALRAAPHLAEWAAGYRSPGRDDITETTMRAGHQLFITQALQKLSAQ